MIMNITPWLCNKQKYIMMSGLVPGSQQSENDIDTYFRTLFKDLKVLWYNDGVCIWNEHKLWDVIQGNKGQAIIETGDHYDVS
jgi:hypothetical protein